MKYQCLLFSRSINKDYRWMIVPEYLSTNELKFIEDNFWSDRIRTLLPLYPSTIYLFHLANCAILIRLCTTNRSDKLGRRIDALQGICVPNYYNWYMRFILPWLLTDVEKFVAPLNDLDLQSADGITYSKSKDYNFDMSQLNHKPTGMIDLMSLFRINLGNSSDSRQRNLEFNDDGYKQLIQLSMPVGRNMLKLIQVAFGILPDKKDVFAEFDVVSFINVR